MKKKTSGRYLFQLVAGTRRHPAGVCGGYFTSPEAARAAHRMTGYVRRVLVPHDLIESGVAKIWQ